MNPRASAARQPPRAARWLALAALLLATAANLQHLAWWCVPLLAGAAAWHARAALRGTPLPGRVVRWLLVGVLSLAVATGLRGHGALAACATLLACMTAAKLLEARTLRDWYVLLGGTLFLLLAACLDRQQLPRLPLYAACLWACLAAARGIERLGQPRPGELLRGAGRQLLLALPLAAALFLLVPRLPGAFWSLPGDDAAITGLGEEMTPGDFARLVESDQPALRVRFAGALPPLADRYWRGPVLHEFDGATWRRGPPLPATGPGLAYEGPRYHYALTVEPGPLAMVPAMQYAAPPAAPFVRASGDYQLLLPRPLGQAQSWELDSWPMARAAGPLGDAERALDLRLPPGRNPRALALARGLRAGAADDAAFVRALLALFADGYTYTLQPQRLGRDSVDDLLFGTREGFCGHFASAFVTLARAGGVPARVVTGYLGGEWNPVGGYLTVRAAEAHAWAEVWMPGRGWTRTDPTAVVSPERLERGSYDVGLGGTGGLARALRRSGWASRLVLAWEAAGAWWQDRILGFNFARQADLLGRLGVRDAQWQQLGLLLGGALAAWMLAIGWGLGRELRPRRDPLARAWLRVEARLRRRGHVRAPHEGVAGFGERLAAADAALGAALAPLLRDYLALRYGEPRGAAAQAAFVREARRWRCPP